jgi:hypothetical protein
VPRRPTPWRKRCMARRYRSSRLLLVVGAVVASLMSCSVAVSAAGTPPVLHLLGFSSPDHKVTCGILGGEHPALGCTADDGFHGGIIDSEEVGVCNHPPGRIYCNTHGGEGPSRALPDGRTVEAEGFRCVSERGGIACIQTSGRLAGRGFWVDRNRAVRIRRPVPPKTPPPTPSGEHFRHCGTVTKSSDQIRVEILSGPVSCLQARQAAGSYAAGEGTFHGPVNGPRSQQYVTLPNGWRCGVIEQGSVSCGRGGSTIALIV